MTLLILVEVFASTGTIILGLYKIGYFSSNYLRQSYFLLDAELTVS
ncbi:MAG: hypothetical protein SXA11_13585 [Cyanobacteriota bacterium]|nr:hypothetical protein [Cyanobacteriota bacterium]